MKVLAGFVQYLAIGGGLRVNGDPYAGRCLWEYFSKAGQEAVFLCLNHADILVGAMSVLQLVSKRG